MMRSFLVSLVPVALVLASCAGPRELSPAERKPMAHATPPRQPLPDDVERTAGRMAALVLADRPDSAAELLTLIKEHDAELETRGEPPSGLTDNSIDRLNTMDGSRSYLQHAHEMLERDDIDPELRRRLERYIDSQPLRLAERRLREDRVTKFGSVINRITAPVSQFLIGGQVPTVETGRAAIASLLLMHSFPEATIKERQALRAYQEFVERYPDAPEREEVTQKIARYERELRHQLYVEALEAAERAEKARVPEAALMHLDRADRLIPDEPEAQELRARAETARAQRDQQILESLGARSLVGIRLDP